MAKRNLRQVLDAYVDIGGGSGANELPDSAIMTGWTTRIVQYMSQFVSNTSTLYTFYSNLYEDASGDFPHNDGITITGGNQASFTNTTINNGLKHYHQQMQAMKGGHSPGLAGDFSSVGTPSSSIHVVDAGQGGGNYANSLISLGEMRGFQYHQNYNGVYPSTSGTTETLENTGAISVGSTA